MSALCDAMDWSPPGSSVHGILQATILEWVSISPSRDQIHIFCIGRHLRHWGNPNHVMRGLEISFPSPWPQKRKESLEVESITNSQWCNQSCLCNEVSIKTQNYEFPKASGLPVEQVEIWGEGTLWEDMEALCPYSTPCLRNLFQLAVYELYILL